MFLDNYLPLILYMPVPQTGQTPLSALRPFFIVTSCASFMSLFALHLTQYASDILSTSSRKRFVCLIYRPL